MVRVKYSTRHKKKHNKKSKKFQKKKNNNEKNKSDIILISSNKKLNENEITNETPNNTNIQDNKIFLNQKKEESLLIIDGDDINHIQTEKIQIQKNQSDIIKLIKIEKNDVSIKNAKTDNIIINYFKIDEANNKYRPKGLQNFASNCYMNSLLQCLYYCKEFREFFLQKKFEEEQLICQAMKDVMKGLNVQDGKKFFSPKKIKNEIKKDIIFKDGEGSDATDLLDFIFVGIMSELEKDNSSVHTVQYQNKTEDKRIVYREIYNEVNFEIIINRLFVGFYEKEFKTNDKLFNYSFQSEYRIVFSLEEIFSYYKGKNVLNLYDCFNHYIRLQKIENDFDQKNNNSFEEFDKKNNWEESEEEESKEEYEKKSEDESNEKSEEKSEEKTGLVCGLGAANKCDENNGNLIEKIFRTPKYLIIILDRGYKKKCDKKIIFDEEIDLSMYMDDERYEYSTKYKLTGVCVHHGQTGNFGHYTSICLCDDNNYYRLNDSHASLLKTKDEFYKDSPYILFYSRLDLPKYQKIFKYYFYQLKLIISNHIKKIEQTEKYELEKKIDFYIMKVVIKENGIFTNKTTTIEIDLSKFGHKWPKPKIKIKKIFKAETRNKTEEENIYWDFKLSVEENKKIFEEAISSYFKEFQKKCFCYLF